MIKMNKLQNAFCMEVDSILINYIIAANGFLFNENPLSEDSEKFDAAVDVIEKLPQEKKVKF